MDPGICDICGNVGGLHSCVLCGKRVCAGCYVVGKGICVVCARGMQFRQGEDVRDIGTPAKEKEFLR